MPSDPLELEFWTLGSWESHLDPWRQQQVLLTAKPSLSPSVLPLPFFPDTPCLSGDGYPQVKLLPASSPLSSSSGECFLHTPQVWFGWIWSLSFQHLRHSLLTSDCTGFRGDLLLRRPVCSVLTCWLLLSC